MLFATREQDPIGSIRVERVRRIRDSNGEGDPKCLRDFLEPLRLLERTGLGLADCEPGTRSFIHEVENGSDPIRAVGRVQAARKPETTVGAAYVRPSGVDTAAPGPTLVNAGVSAEFPDLVDTQNTATERTSPTCACVRLRGHCAGSEPGRDSSRSSVRRVSIWLGPRVRSNTPNAPR